MPDLRCTYRVQLTPELGFRRVREVVLPYLRDLGVPPLYLSPVLKAQAGSTHGYDVVDPTRVSAELGGEDELRALCEAGRVGGGEPPLARPGAARAVLRLGPRERL